MKKIFLTSTLAILVATPTMAAVGDDTFTANSNNAGMCNVDVLGVYAQGATANATAQFNPDSYECQAGYYLPANATACAACTAGNYCPGSAESEDATDGEFVFNASNASGLVSCQDEWGDAFPLSDAGADNADACYVSAPCPSNLVAANCDPHAATCTYTNDAVLNGKIYAEGESGPDMPRCSMTFTCATGYTKSTTQTAPTLPDAATNGNSYQYRSHLYPNGGSNSNNDNDLTAGEWKVSWTSGATQGTMKGIASCNSIGANTNGWTWSNDSSNWTLPANTNLANNSADSSDASRRYCWCKPTSWTPSGGAEQSLSAAWVFYDDHDDADNCANACASYCAYRVSDDSAFRGALFGVVGASSQCVANTLNINWKNEDGTTFETGQCTYDGNLATPSGHPDKRGHTFSGWRFSSQQ